MGVCRLLFNDQLSESISSLKGVDKSGDIILMCELFQTFTQVKHHQKKCVYILSAMRSFGAQLVKKGYSLDYVKLNNKKKKSTYTDEIRRVIKEYKVEKIVITEPSEYDLNQEIQEWSKTFKVDVEIREDDRFLCSIDDFHAWAKDKKSLRMEYFYRTMRKKYNVLMEGDQPVGGQWNFDKDNRKPPNLSEKIIQPLHLKPSSIIKEVIALVQENFNDHFGDIEPFNYALTRKDALRVLKYFINHNLNLYGPYQDAMIEGQPFMYHSMISFYLNSGLLTPLECIKAAENAWLEGGASLQSVEAFIRQIMGWREFVRGVYWLKMPNYKKLNYLKATKKLPGFFWTGDTDLNCLKQSIEETKNNAYAHHIQRLMVLGNFLLLIGAHPDEVNEWYWIVYADAYEWVELPNVSGMVLFADEGVIASKPYASSGAYINKMSNYCKNCRYRVKEKNGPDACPFNYLYWGFLMNNKKLLSGNPRLSMMYRQIEKMSESKVQSIKKDTLHFFKKIALASYKK